MGRRGYLAHNEFERVDLSVDKQPNRPRELVEPPHVPFACDSQGVDTMLSCQVLSDTTEECPWQSDSVMMFDCGRR